MSGGGVVQRQLFQALCWGYHRAHDAKALRSCTRSHGWIDVGFLVMGAAYFICGVIPTLFTRRPGMPNGEFGDRQGGLRTRCSSGDPRGSSNNTNLSLSGKSTQKGTQT
ncbi:hypothetical protein PspCFBP13528_15345 [Pseudomonas sp. CFBP13528]|nr:hypothetical protein PspCFBP13528_15345 [Pseudomonas sp. CFBP13528]